MTKKARIEIEQMVRHGELCLNGNLAVDLRDTIALFVESMKKALKGRT